MADSGNMITDVPRPLVLPGTPPLLAGHLWRVLVQCQFIISEAAANGSAAGAIPPLVALMLQQVLRSTATATASPRDLSAPEFPS